jgi:Protein of unknown function (DUF4232)
VLHSHVAPGRLRALLLSATCCAALLWSAGLMSASSAQIARCATGQLRLSVLDVPGAAGHRYWDMTLRNHGAERCSLEGYPGIGLLDGRGELIADNVDRQPGYPTPSVIVAHDQRAYFSFAYTVSGPCAPHDFKAYGLEVYPPDQYGALRLSTHGPLEVCDRSLGGAPLVYPIRSEKALD